MIIIIKCAYKLDYTAPLLGWASATRQIYPEAGDEVEHMMLVTNFSCLMRKAAASLLCVHIVHHIRGSHVLRPSSIEYCRVHCKFACPLPHCLSDHDTCHEALPKDLDMGTLLQDLYLVRGRKGSKALSKTCLSFCTVAMLEVSEPNLWSKSPLCTRSQGSHLVRKRAM